MAGFRKLEEMTLIESSPGRSVLLIEDDVGLAADLRHFLEE